MLLDEDSLLDHINDNAGYCTICDDFTIETGVEPDAEKYICPKCGNNSVMGAEQALIYEYVKDQ